jgi:hypothetical protein
MMKIRHIAALCLLSSIFSTGHAQTSIAIPAASGGGIKHVLPQRFGINLDSQNGAANSQMMANLIAGNGATFAPQIWNQGSICAASGATTTVWPDNVTFGAQPANFWQGATYQVYSGANIGATGTITSNTMANGSTTGALYTLSAALSSPCAANDILILRCRTANSTCAGGLTPAHVSGFGALSLYFTGAGAATFETSDLSPSSASTQALQLYAPVYSSDEFSNDNAAINPGFDGAIGPLWTGNWLNMNGTYTLTFRAKASSAGTGTPTIRYKVSRTGGGTVWLNSFVTPTVNSTPGAGWTNYSFSFSASETGAQPVQPVIVQVLGTGGTILVQDVALTEAQTATGNDTAFRDAVFLYLQAHKPGTLRFMNGAIAGCTLDALIATSPLSCGNTIFAQYGYVNAWNLNQFLYLAAKVGANPWFTMSPFATPADWANAAAYFNAPCSSGNSYATIRCNFLAGTPYAGETWVQVFNSVAPSGVGNIYLENGNEVWNVYGQTVFWNNSTSYGLLVGADNAALKTSAYYSSQIHQVASGFVGSPSGPYSWAYAVMTAACGITNGCPDFIDGAPYVFNWATDMSTPNVWTSMFAEPVNLNSTSGGNVNQMQVEAAAFGANTAIYETNLGTGTGITGDTQSQINGIVAGVGSGLDATLNMLLGARDVGIGVQNFFSLPEIANEWSDCTSITSNSCAANSALFAPLWGGNRYMPGPEASGIMDRPSGLMLQGINQAIGTKLNLLNTVQTGTPTYSQAAAQPLPTYVYPFTGNLNSTTTVSSVSNFGGLIVGGVITGTGIPTGDTIASLNSGAGTLTLAVAATATATGVNLTSAFMTIAANSTVPYVQAFGFGDGLGNYSVIAYNLDSVSSHAITFTGSGAPTGSCTKTVFTSTNITDNNETTWLGGTPVVSYPSPGSYPNCYTGDTLPPYSMTTYVYAPGAVTAYPPTFSPPAGSYTGTQTVTLATATGGCTADIVWNTTNAQSGGNLTGTSSTNPITVSATETIYAQVQGCGGYLNSSISSAAYTISTGAQTWYVRTDGGSIYDANQPSGQCDGKGDAAYPGTGVNQHCAVNDFRYLWDDQSGVSGASYLWQPAGGDTIIIRGCAHNAHQTENYSPDCRIGWDTPTGTPYTWAIGRSNGGAHMPPIPNGTSGQHTVIEGGNFASCAAKSSAAVLFGGFGVSWEVDLTGSPYVDLNCLNITSHTQAVSGTNGICITHGTGYGVPCNTTVGSSLSDYDGDGIETTNTTGPVNMTNVWLDGHSSSGIHGPIGGIITLNHVYFQFNGFAGWNFDDGSATPDGSGAQLLQSYVTMLGNGCNQEWPIVDAYPGQLCFDLNDGGFGDSWSGQQTNLGTLTCDHCTVLYNTKDGMIGPHTFLANMSLTNSTWQGNMGQVWKWNSQTGAVETATNNVINGNCNRMSQPITGWPSGFNTPLSLYCRASADVISVSGAPSSVMLFANNTITTYQNTIWDFNCVTVNGCTTAQYITKNNLIWGDTVATNYYPGANGNAPGVYYISDSSDMVTASYNLEFGVRDGTCYGGGVGTNGVCADPLLTGEPAQGSVPPETSMDVFSAVGTGFYPTSSSPAKLAGTTYTGLPSTDFYNTATTSPPVIGAVNAMAAAGFSTITSGHTIKSGHIITQ